MSENSVKIKSTEEVMIEHELAAARKILGVTTASRAKTIEELREDVMKYLNAHWEENRRGFSLAHMNRKYGILCRELGKSISALIQDMHERNMLAAYPFKKSLIIISTQIRPRFVVSDDLPLDEIATKMDQVEKYKVEIFEKSLD